MLGLNHYWLHLYLQGDSRLYIDIDLEFCTFVMIDEFVLFRNVFR